MFSNVRLMWVLSTVTLTLASGCDQKQEQSEETPTAPPAQQEPLSGSGSGSGSGASMHPAAPLGGSADAAVAAAGLPQTLIQYGCYACHDVNGARIGPPYRAIAGLYRNDSQAADKLTQKIINGGSGVWGPVPMVAHYQLAPEEVRPLVEAILKLN